MNKMTIKYGNQMSNTAKGTRFIRLLGTANMEAEARPVRLDINEDGPDKALFDYILNDLLLKYGKPENLGNGKGKGVVVPCVILEADDGFSISESREVYTDPKTAEEVFGDYNLYLNGGAMRLAPRKPTTIG